MRAFLPRLRVTGFCLLLGIGIPISAHGQTTGSDAGTTSGGPTTSGPTADTMAGRSELTSTDSTSDRTMRDDWGFNPGWLGMVGLIGLLGMMPKDRRERTPATTTVTREHGR